MVAHVEKVDTGSSAAVADPDQHTLRKRPYRIRSTPFSAILDQKYAGSGTEEDPYAVEWLADDSENPMTLPQVYKWLVTVQVSIATLCVSLSSTAYSGATISLRESFQVEQILVILGISLFVLGWAFGPLLWAPMSEVLGRRNLFVFTNLAFTLWQGVAIASPNIQSLLVLRFLSGLFGASPLVNSGGTLTDMFSANQRGLAMALFAAAPFLGPALGPITGGFLAEAGGWRWVLAYVAILAGVVTAVGALTFPETYAPYLLRQRARRLSKVTGKHYICKLDKGKDLRLKTMFSVALSRPWLLLFYEPIVLLLSIYIAVVYGILYSLFGAFPIVFQQQRGWSPGIGGLAFCGVLVGVLLAVAYIVFYENPRYVRIAKQLGGVAAPPEVRLPSCMVGAVAIVVGLATFAATDSPSIHWIVPIIAEVPFGFGVVLIFLSLMNYLTDSYLIYAASVLAANSVIRSLFAFAFPLFVKDMYLIGGEANGIHWGPAIGGFLALIFLPFPFIFARYGAKIRARCKYSSEAAAFLEQLRSSSQPGPDGKPAPVAGPDEASGYVGDVADDPELLRQYTSHGDIMPGGGGEGAITNVNSSRSHSSVGHR